VKSRTLAPIAFIGFALTLALHLLTFLPLDFTHAIALFFLPFVGMFPVFAAMVFDLRVRFGRTHFAPAEFGGIAAEVPWPMRVLAVAVVAYIALNFITCLRLTQGGQAERQGAAYVLVSHGTVIATLTHAQYIRQSAYTARLFTGHPLIFFLLPGLYFRYIAPRMSSTS
jgi:hypothetical protein